jgi:hypothetical protein
VVTLPKIGNAHKRRYDKNEFPEAISPRSIKESRKFVGQSDKIDQTNYFDRGPSKFDRPKTRIEHAMRFPDL